MSIPGSANPLLLASAAVAGGYEIQRSVRLNSADSAYLSRTPASSGNRKTWTWAGWVKRSGLGAYTALFSAGTSNTDITRISFDSNERIEVLHFVNTTVAQLLTTPVYRDFSSWYHIVVSSDTTQATASDRWKIWVNGVQITAFTAAIYPAQNTDYFINAAANHAIGGQNAASLALFISCYLADIHFIDGQSLTPSSFTEVSATTGQLIPKAYTGTYGTNGFYLKFADNSNNTATTLGKDSSGNGNNWTPNNLSVTAGSGNDSLVDTPTSYGTDTGAGGEVRGNYATLNPLDKNGNTTLSNGNLNAVGYNSAVLGTFGLTTGKWYWEVVHTDSYGPGYWGNVGVVTNLSNSVYTSSGFAGVNVTTQSDIGGTWSAGSRVTASTSWANNDVVGMAFDADAKTLDCYKNGVKIGSTLSVPTGAIFPSSYLNGTSGDTSSAFYNFGQRPFQFPAPSGFKALCTQNLP